MLSVSLALDTLNGFVCPGLFGWLEAGVERRQPAVTPTSRVLAHSGPDSIPSTGHVQVPPHSWMDQETTSLA